MKNNRSAIAEGLKILLASSFIDFSSWGLLKLSKKHENNQFLISCYDSLSRSFLLQVANLFDGSKGVCSIKKYLTELQKSKNKEDKIIFKKIRKLLNDNENKLRRLKNKRGNDLAHNNLEIIKDIQNGIPEEKRKSQSKENRIHENDVMECLFLAEKIYKIISEHELGHFENFKEKIHTIIEQDFRKCFEDTSANTA